MPSSGKCAGFKNTDHASHTPAASNHHRRDPGAFGDWSACRKQYKKKIDAEAAKLSVRKYASNTLTNVLNRYTKYAP